MTWRAIGIRLVFGHHSEAVASGWATSLRGPRNATQRADAQPLAIADLSPVQSKIRDPHPHYQTIG